MSIIKPLRSLNAQSLDDANPMPSLMESNFSTFDSFGGFSSTPTTSVVASVALINTPAPAVTTTSSVVASAALIDTPAPAVATTSSGSGEAGASSGSSSGSTTTLGNQVSGSNVISVARESYIARPNGLYNLGAMFQVSPGFTTSPAKLSVTVYDRENYGGVETHNFGTLYANNGATYRAGGYTLNFSQVNGQYMTANGMTLADFTYSASTQEDRTAHFNMTAYNAAGSVLTQRDVDVVTHSTYTDTTAGVVTGAEIAKVAQSYIGKVWDDSGCWVLASNIAASAGGSLCLNSGWITSQISDNGQFTVAYNAYKGINANWMNTLQAGDIVELGWKNANFGHIFTIDRVTNGAAYLVDNSGASYKGAGADKTDVYVAEQKLSSYAPSIDQSTVVVYRANGAKPTVANLAATTMVNDFTNVGVGKSIAVGSLFRVTDADNDAITQYQVRDGGNGGGFFTLNGVRQVECQWITINASQLAQLGFTGSSSGSVSDTIEVKAYDGKTWGAADSGRIVSLWDQTSQKDEQTFRNFGAIDKNNNPVRATEWVSSSDKYDWWTFSISSKATAVDVQLSNMVGQVNMYVFDSKGAVVGAAYGYSFNNTACKLTGTLGVGTYTIRLDDYLGDTNYDLTVGKAGTLPSVMSGGATQMMYANTAMKPSSGGAPESELFGGMSPLSGTAPSLSYADSTGLDGLSNASLFQADPLVQNDRLLMAASRV
ncbi:PPC domain-containing protein [uncultured Gammaproteobacteria bacterium]